MISFGVQVNIGHYLKVRSQIIGYLKVRSQIIGSPNAPTLTPNPNPNPNLGPEFWFGTGLLSSAYFPNSYCIIKYAQLKFHPSSLKPLLV